MAKKSQVADSMNSNEIAMYDAYSAVAPFETGPFQPVKAGRPSEIDTRMLLNRRREMLWLLEENWAEIALELKKARTIAGLRKALEPLRGQSEFDLLVCTTTRSNPRGILKRKRDALRREQERYRALLKEERREKESWDTASKAMETVKRGQDLEFLEKLCIDYERSHTATVTVLRTMASNMEPLREVLRRMEAYFSQTELLDFIVSQRYALEPLNLANALAGLPYIAWRRSLERCAKVIPGPSGNSGYEILGALRNALAVPPKDSQLAVAQVRRYIVAKRRHSDPVIHRMREDFYFLRVSIEAVYMQRPVPSALPFHVAVEFRRRSAIRSPYDQLMRNQEKL